MRVEVGAAAREHLSCFLGREPPPAGACRIGMTTVEEDAGTTMVDFPDVEEDWGVLELILGLEDDGATTGLSSVVEVDVDGSCSREVSLEAD